jgi:nitrogen fixation-related uncharacterized protein
MPVITTILIGSAILLPAAALLALRWAADSGQLSRAEKASLLPFDESEPLGVETDRVLGGTRR